MSLPLDDDAVRKLARLGAGPDDEPIPEGTRVGRDGRYVLLREIGRGGMGVVHEAYDTFLRRKVALKLLSERAGVDLKARQRFAREALAAARLRHPGIAAVHDATPEFIAMELLSGVTLDRFPAGNPRLVVRLLRDAALAVQAAHEAGIVHRDLKPANLMVEDPDSAEPRVRVMDFGLAKETAAETSLSLSGHVIGTPAYMAPEQARGRIADIDERSDVYGLGATLWSSLAGAPPHEGEDVARVLEKVIDREPVPIERIRNDVGRDFGTILAKAMAKDRDLRYASAREFADDLDRWLRQDPVLAKRPSLLYRARKFSRRHRIPLSAAASAALLTAAATLFVVLEERTRRSAIEEALRLSSTVSALVRDAEDAFLAGTIDVRGEKLRQAIALCRAHVATSDSAQGHHLLGSLLYEIEEYREAIDSLDRALDLDPTLDDARFLRGLVLLDFSALPETAGGPPSLVRGHYQEQARKDLPVHERSQLAFRTVDVLYGEARLALLDRDREKARENLSAIVHGLDPYHVAALRALAELVREEDNDEAIRLSSRAMDLENGFGAILRGDGVTSRDELPLSAPGMGALASRPSSAVPEPISGIYREALRCIRRAQDWGNEGDAPRALEEWRSAVALFTEALEQAPEPGTAWNDRGVARAQAEKLLLAQGQTALATAERMHALSDFSQALSRVPALVEARLNRALLHERHADLLEAGGLLEEAKGCLARAVDDLDEADRILPFASPLRDAVEAARARLSRRTGAGE